MFLPCWHYSLHRSENSRKRSLWQYQGWLTSVCERSLFPGTQHRTQYNDGSVLEIMLWRYTLVPWALERSLVGSITLIHTPEVTFQGWKTWETGGVCSPVSAEDTCKAASYSDFCKVRASSAVFFFLYINMINHLEINTDRTTVLVQASHTHKYVYTHVRMNSKNGLILLCLAGWWDSELTRRFYSSLSGSCLKYMLPPAPKPLSLKLQLVELEVC